MEITKRNKEANKKLNLLFLLNIIKLAQLLLLERHNNNKQ